MSIENIEQTPRSAGFEKTKAIFCMSLGIGSALGMTILFASAKRYELAALMAVIAFSGGVASHDELKKAYEESEKKKISFIGYLPEVFYPHTATISAEIAYHLNPYADTQNF